MFATDTPPKTTRVAAATRALLWANLIGLFLTAWYRSSGVTWFDAAYGLVPTRVFLDPRFESLKFLTSLFLHEGYFHFTWNMLFLWLYGDAVEEALGRFRQLALYLFAGVAGSAAELFLAKTSTSPIVGSSGALAGVLAAYFVLHPKGTVRVWNPILPMWLVSGPFFVLPSFMAFGLWYLGHLAADMLFGGTLPGFAPLGGALFALLTTRLFWSSRGPAGGSGGGTSGGGKRSASGAPTRRIFWKEDGRPFWK